MPTETGDRVDELLQENTRLRAELQRLSERLRAIDALRFDQTRRTILHRTSELLRTNDELRRQLATNRITEDQLRLIGTVVETSNDGILILTPAVEESGPRIAFANEAFTRITEIPRTSLVAETLDILKLEEGEPPLRLEIMKRMFAGEPFEGESPARRGTGAEYTAEIKTIPIRDPSGFISHWILFLRDISAERAQIVTLERKAQFDPLTELPNRLLLFDRLAQAVLLQPRLETSVALMIIDLDRFKEVNDGFGHLAGDLLLKQVAFRLKNLLRESDTVARLGGDEFAIVLPQVADAEAALDVAQRIHRAFASPYLLEKRSVSVGASIGIALCPEHGEDETTLLRHADVAMYRAKQSGSESCLYSPEHDEDPTGRYGLVANLRQAIDQDQLVLHYQPKVDLRRGTVVGVETLVRWQHPQEGLLYPDRFIHVAESSGLIRQMSVWVFDRAVRQTRAWEDQGYTIQVAVNLSPTVLRDGTLPETVSEILQRHNVRPERLRVEITESSMLADPAQALGVLSLLRTLGVSIAIDDFGTGYSSLANLRQVPFDEIKVDKSFVLAMLSNQGDAAIVRATINLAHSLGAQVIAEGVENEQTMIQLLEWDCDLAQGYFISRPLDAEGFIQWLTNSTWDPALLTA